MSLSKLFAIVVALAVLLAPAFTRAGEAFASVPDHHAQMMQSGECHAPETGVPEESGDKAPVKDCCISMCMAVAMMPPAPMQDGPINPEPAVSAIPALQVSHLAEIATPPPRRA
jgi:hypothetical protein